MTQSYIIWPAIVLTIGGLLWTAKKQELPRPILTVILLVFLIRIPALLLSNVGYALTQFHRYVPDNMDLLESLPRIFFSWNGWADAYPVDGLYGFWSMVFTRGAETFFLVVPVTFALFYLSLRKNSSSATSYTRALVPWAILGLAIGRLACMLVPDYHLGMVAPFNIPLLTLTPSAESGLPTYGRALWNLPMIEAILLLGYFVLTFQDQRYVSPFVFIAFYSLLCFGSGFFDLSLSSSAPIEYQQYPWGEELLSRLRWHGLDPTQIWAGLTLFVVAYPAFRALKDKSAHHRRRATSLQDKR